MIVYLPVVAFAVGMLLAYAAAGRRRQAGTMVMVLAAAWSLALLVNIEAVAWAVGPVLATILLPRPAERKASTFEVLTRRTTTIAGLTVLALFLAAQLPIGLNPTLLTALPWLLGAVGTAWTLSPIDTRERLQGQVLMVGATAAIILATNPTNGATAAAAGAMSMAPLIGQRRLAQATRRQLLSSLVLALATLAAIVAASGVTLERQSVGDIAVGFSGPALLGVTVVLLAAALSGPPGSEWTGLLGALPLLVLSPALRWAAIASLVAIATLTDRDGERPAWLAVALLAAIPVMQAIAPPAWSLRVQTVALGCGLVLMLYAARGGLLRAVLLPAVIFLALGPIELLTTGNLTRLQWIVAVGALLLVARALLRRIAAKTAPTVRMTGPLLMGLLLLAIGARDAPSLGALAVALLLVDLAIVEPGPADVDRSSRLGRLTLLARSNWPPSVGFAGGILAVIAAIQASLALGLLAALMLASLQLAPLLDRTAPPPMVERPISRLRWLVPALSLGCGALPAVVMRMLRL